MRPGERQVAMDDGPFALPGTPVEAGPSTPTEAEPSDPPPGIPDIPDAVREAARSAPDHWLGVLDPEWPQDRPPPDWALVGEWRADDEGEVQEYRANPRYRPSARVLGRPEPTDPVDAAAQRPAATGYGTAEEALTALAHAEVSVVRGVDGQPLTAAGADGKPVVLVFTSPAHRLLSSTLLHDPLPAGELAAGLHGSDALLMVNATAAAPLPVPADSLPKPASGADTVPERAAGTTVRTVTSTADADAARPDTSGHAPLHTTGRTP